MKSKRSSARPLARTLLALAPLALVLGGCATTDTDDVFDAEEEVMVEVRSDHPQADNLVVTAVSNSGVRRRLGILNASGDGNFTFDPPGLPEEYRLVAESGRRTVATSEPFLVTERGSTIRWDLDVGRVQIRN